MEQVKLNIVALGREDIVLHVVVEKWYRNKQGIYSWGRGVHKQLRANEVMNLVMDAEWTIDSGSRIIILQS